MKHLVAQYSVPRRPLFLELGEDTRLICCKPLRCHALHYAVTVAASLPERDDLLAVYPFYLVVNTEADFLAAVKDFEILH